MQLFARIQRQYQVIVPHNVFYTDPTVACLAREVEAAVVTGCDNTAAAVSSLVAVLPRPKRSKVSHAQQRMWLLDQLSHCKAVYNISLAWDIRGRLDVAVLQKAIDLLLVRHDSLRTVFQSKPDDTAALEQVVLSSATCEVTQINASSHEVALRLVRIESQTVFDLTQGPLVKANLFWIGEAEFVFQLTMHHIITDGWSSGIIKRDLAEIYNTLLRNKKKSKDFALDNGPLTKNEFQYTDFSIWQRKHLSQSELTSRQLAYWKDVLKNAPQHTELLIQKKASASKTQQAANHYTVLSADLMDGLSRVAASANTTVFTVLLSALHLLLVKYSNQSDTVIGSPVSGRTCEEVSNIVGFFVNTVALRVQSTGDMSFYDLLLKVRDVVFGAMENQDVPFDLVVGTLNLSRDLGANPLFQVMLDFQSSAPAPLSLDEIETQKIEIDFDLAKFDLVLHVVMGDNGSCKTCFEYSTDLFESASIAQMALHFEALLQNIISSPSSVRVNELSVASAAERETLLVDWNRTTAPYPNSTTMHQWVQQQAFAYPSTPAVLVGKQTLTYSELDHRASRIACYLQSLGVTRDSIVAISLDRSVDFVVWALGVLRAGGAYLPLDTKYPDDRLLYMLQDAKPVVLATQSAYLSRFQSVQESLSIVLCDKADSALSALPASCMPVLVADPHQLAYVIYTSGSTGKPKGVMVEHHSLCNLVQCFQADFKGRRVLQVASNSFDAAVFEIWTCLGSGGTLVLAEPEELLFGDSLRQLLIRQKVSVALITPAALATLDDNVQVPDLKVLYIGGDSASERLFILWRGKVDKVVNAYGPTEATVIATCLEFDGMKSSRVIGRPIANTLAYVLDSTGEVVPLGLPGELYIGGAGVARGYLHNPVLTAERFVRNCFSADIGARMYRTGDLVRYLPTGDIEFLGRADGQVKLRGYRIECGEIERAICQHSSVKDAVVVLREDTPGMPQLVAYLVSRDSTPLSSDILVAVKGSLLKTLPKYMVPSAFVVLEVFPITPNGKTDKTMLPPPSLTIHEDIQPQVPLPPAHFASLRSGMSKTLIRIWQQVLGLSSGVDIDVNFFDAGGNSLSLSMVHGMLPPAWKAVVTLIDLFKHSTIRTLCEHIAAKTSHASSSPMSAFARKRSVSLGFVGGEDSIAMIGIGCTVPGADSPTQFWDNLRSGVESIKRYSNEELLEIGVESVVFNNPHYVKARGAIADVRGFDAEFFGISAREAEIMDPQQRVFLECAWAALEDAGYDPHNYPGHIGVYAGCGDPRYYTKNLLSRPEVVEEHGHYLLGIYNNKDMLATRTAHKLGLTGPAIGIQTACSSSLVAVHQACQSLLSNDCHMALAGGVSLGDLEGGYMYQEGMILSPDGHCRAFDAQAAGTVPGQGAGVVVLKRLSQAIADGDAVYAVIKGSAINNDGSAKIGFTAPSADRQAKVLMKAFQKAKILSSSISFIEAHGTGTKVGDPIELSGLSQAFSAVDDKSAFKCRIGSVKTNIGHLDAASGVVGLIKTSLSLIHAQIPATLHFNVPNSAAHERFPVNRLLCNWPKSQSHERRAGVSSFGIGGTNAHVILEGYHAIASTARSRPTGGSDFVLLPVSAKNEECLRRMSDNLSMHLKSKPAESLSLNDVAYTLQLGRRVFSHRRVVVAKSIADAAEQLLEEPSAATKSVVSVRSVTHRRPVVFIFCGQGGAAVTGERHCDLYKHEKTFRATVDRCVSLLNSEFESHSFAWSSRTSSLFASPPIEDTYLKQIELFVVEYALYEMYAASNILPDLVLGHSLGEYTAACTAGVMTLKDALLLVAHRALLMKQLPTGLMMSVQMSHIVLKTHLQEHKSLDVAAVNSSNQCVVSGASEDILAFRDALESKNISCKVLPLPHAFHSRKTQGIVEELNAIAKQMTFSPPNIRFVSTTTGLEVDSALPCSHWTKHLQQPVLFSPVVSDLARDESPFVDAVYLELGPGRLLSNLVKSHLPSCMRSSVISSLGEVRASSEYGSVLHSVGQLWLNNIDIDWEALHRGSGQKLSRVHLPTYPFKHTQYWIEASQLSPASSAAPPPNSKYGRSVFRDLPINSFSDTISHATAGDTTRVARVWQSFFRIKGIGAHDRYADLGGDSLMAVRLAALLEAEFCIAVNSSIFIEHDTIAKQSVYFANKIATTEKLFLAPEEHRKCPSQPNKAFELIQLSPGDDPKQNRIPLILVHPIGGTVNTYSDLVTALDKSHPVYAFQALSPFGQATPYSDFNTMCRDYVTELRCTFPAPGQQLILGGSSFGGIAAYEMANILKAQQQFSTADGDVCKVPLVVMLDAPVPGTIPPFEGLAPLLSFLFAEKTGLKAQDEQHLVALEGNREAQMDFIYNQAKQKDLAHFLPDRSVVHHIVDTWSSHGRAMHGHTLTSYDGDVLYFRALVASPRLTNMQHAGWLELCTSSIEVRAVNGTHQTMNQLPHIEGIAECLHRAMVQKEAASLRWSSPK